MNAPSPLPYVLLDNSLDDTSPCRLFERPRELVVAKKPEEVEIAIERLMAAQREGLYAAGFLAYELGYLMEPKLAPLLPEDRAVPLIWMGLFAEPRDLSRSEAAAWLAAQDDDDYRLDDLRLSWSREEYLAAFDAVKDYIAAGDVYQINLTFKYRFEFSGSPLALYSELRGKQRVRHGALIRTADFDLLSISPELFLRCKQGKAEARPMKGTAPRGRTPEEDDALADTLKADAKSQAENLMIVDLLRNDLGRTALIGSVRVNDLFTVERYPTVHQMTSGIEARLRPAIGLKDILGGLFPCGSITGAPKVRAMEIIRELESEARGIYTGAVGMIEPCGDLSFNVAIRSLVIQTSGAGEMGIGSGVVFDSDGQAEYEECLLKAEFLTRPYRPFQLIETLRWTKTRGYYLLERHLGRLARSARRFGFSFDAGRVEAALARETETFQAAACRVRLLLGEAGEITLAHVPIELPGPESVMSFALSDRPADSADPFFYHKTTNRAFYEDELARLQRLCGCDEAIFVNERGELTEGSRTNLFIEHDGVLLTPPLSCGLLDGTLRRELLESGEGTVREALLYPRDLDYAEAIYLGNSVRGLVRAEAAAAAKGQDGDAE